MKTTWIDRFESWGLLGLMEGRTQTVVKTSSSVSTLLTCPIFVLEPVIIDDREGLTD